MLTRIGFALSLLVFCFVMFVQGTTSESAYVSAANFLFYYSCVSSGIFLTVFLFVSLVLPFIMAFKVSEDNNSKGIAVLGFFAGGCLGFVVILLALLKASLFVCGAWLLSTAPQGDTWETFDKVKLLVGGILLLGAMWHAGRISSSDKKD